MHSQARRPAPLPPAAARPRARPAALRLSAATLLAALALAAPDALASEARELSSLEEAELRAGKLVVRPEVRNLHGVQLRGGLAWQLIHSSPEAVYAVLLDERTYVKYLPAVEQVSLVSLPGTSPQSLFVQHRLGFIRGSYYVRTLRDPATRTLRFRMDRSRPSSIRDAWGELRVSPYGRGQCIVSLAIMADLGEGLLIGLVRDNVHTWMLRVPELLKRYVEAQPH